MVLVQTAQAPRKKCCFLLHSIEYSVKTKTVVYIVWLYEYSESNVASSECRGGEARLQTTIFEVTGRLFSQTWLRPTSRAGAETFQRQR